MDALVTHEEPDAAASFWEHGCSSPTSSRKRVWSRNTAVFACSPWTPMNDAGLGEPDVAIRKMKPNNFCHVELEPYPLGRPCSHLYKPQPTLQDR